MTPAIQRLEQLGIEHAVHGYEPARAASDYGIDASAQLGVPAERVFKTLIAELDTHELVVAVVPVSHRLHMKSLARAIEVALLARVASAKEMLNLLLQPENYFIDPYLQRIMGAQGRCIYKTGKFCQASRLRAMGSIYRAQMDEDTILALY